jgi:hypothetical protein
MKIIQILYATLSLEILRNTCAIQLIFFPCCSQTDYFLKSSFRNIFALTKLDLFHFKYGKITQKKFEKKNVRPRSGFFCFSYSPGPN